MRWWKFFLQCSLLRLPWESLGCKEEAVPPASPLQSAPTTASVITNRTQQFSGVVTGSSNTAVNWSLTCATGVAANTCGSIDVATGLFTAPATIPTTTSSGTTSIAPTVGWVTATSQADTSKTATATLTIITGISITIAQTSATVGTSETFTSLRDRQQSGECNITSNPTCDNVTWSLSTTLTGIGTIGSTTGVYTAPSSVPTSTQGGSTVHLSRANIGGG